MPVTALNVISTLNHHPGCMLGALVDYSDDSEVEFDAGGGLTKRPEPVAKPAKRKNSGSSHPPAGPKKSKTLPKLESTLFTPAPADDPSKHQGRTRSIPFVEGQFVGHVYVPIRLEGELLQVLREVVRCAQAVNPAWYSLLDPEAEGSSPPPSKVSVHLSLSRPIPLRAHQRDDLRKEVRRTATQNNQFSASFSQFTVLTNDDKTRTFLCAEVGAGHKQLQELSQSLSSHLASLRQLPYYSQPRFHISIAWILTPPTAPPVPADTTEPSASSKVNHVDQFLETVTSSVGQLQETFSRRLLELGRLDVRSLEVKIGKEITTVSWTSFFTTTRTIMVVPLPLSAELPAGFELDKIDDYISRLLSFLTSPLVETLILAHPNEIAIRGEWPSVDGDSASSWWSWAGNINHDDKRAVIDGLIDSATGRDVPADIHLHFHITTLIRNISALRLPRDMDSAVDIPAPTLSRGMSPKKAHEVDRLGKLVDQISSRLQPQPKTRLIVDVGAGQGYLSHRLAATPSTRVLALDGDESQTEGAALRGQGLSHAQRQQARKDGAVESDQPQHAVTHRTLFITSDSLSRAVDEWVSGLDLDLDTTADVIVTGLHACGGLTPAVLRCFVDLMHGGAGGTWRPSTLALVGCCYNLMRDPNDFPLSQTTTHAATSHPSLKLTSNHLQLAAQCPAQWSRSASERERAALARRKIVWRALLGRMLQARPDPDTASTNRLGRLPDRAYASWEAFAGTACTKMGVLPPSTGEGFGAGVETLAFQLELLHVLRALIGPVIESLIVVDRAVYLAEQVALGEYGVKVRVVNVFDQLNSGSTRNIALVVEPNVQTS